MSTDLGGFNTTQIHLASKVLGWLKNAKSQQAVNGKKVGAVDAPKVSRPNVKPPQSKQFNESYNKRNPEAVKPFNNRKPGTPPAGMYPTHMGEPAPEGRHEQPTFGKHARGRHQGAPAQEGMHEPPAFGRHMKP